ncbi:MAG: 4'-phosphopantetheinyl transferase superfamily protein [Calditrichaeota bacterium]|nr:MAG: 4'-phosphopantetheinyl transferase superfamily protein [Calditrichota bacterium]
MDLTQWRPYDGTLPSGNNLYLWLIHLDAVKDLSGYRAALNSEEKERAGRFYFEKDRRAYIITRGFIKARLSAMIDKPADRITFGYTEKGKPYLPGHTVFFNVSHSGGLALAGMTTLAPLGVDVERFRPDMAGEKIAQRFFSQREVAAFNKLLPIEKTTGFFNAWTRKEAFIKAVGLGLSMPLSAFDVTLKPGMPARLLAVRHAPYKATDWHLKALPVPESYAAAFCIKHQNPEICLWRVPDKHDRID